MRTIYKSIIVIIIETVEYNVSVRFFTSCDVLERKREREQYKIVFKSTRENDIRLAPGKLQYDHNSMFLTLSRL